MSIAKQIFEPLDGISRQMWNDRFDGTTFSTLKEKVFILSTQIAVHQALENTARQLLPPQESIGLSNAPSRLGKFLDVLYGKLDNEKNEARWQKLRDMECATFLLIAVSYTPLDIAKMHRTEFDYLVDNASKFLQVRNFPSNWIFRNEIQIAIAGKANLEKVAQFRRNYHALEFSQDFEKQTHLGILGSLAKRKNMQSKAEHQLLNSSEMENQSEMPAKLQISTSTKVNPTILPAGDGVTSIHPRKRRHMEDTKSLRDKQTESDEQLLTAPTSRQIQYMFSKAPISQIPHLSSLILDAIRSSLQWKMECDRGELATDCLTLMIPEDPTQDISITLWVGQEVGIQMRNVLKLKPTWSSLPGHLSP